MKWSYYDTALLVVISIHLVKAPYTKVEESFTIQAIHDILKYGVFDISKYDHFKFPGVVPRTFIGPLIIALFTKPFILISSLWSHYVAFFNSSSAAAVNVSSSGLENQLLARSIIGLFNALGFIYLKNAAQNLLDKNTEKEQKENGVYEGISTFSSTGTWFLIYVMASFHLMFYSTRPLPNFVMTLPLVNMALGLVLSDKINWAICLLSFTAIIFRLEVIAICAGVALVSTHYKKISPYNVFKFGMMGASFGAGLTITIDSYFWGDWTFPEFDAFLFNVISGNASQWGTEPFTAYFTNYLRMLFLPPTILFLNYLGFQVAPTNLKIISLASYFHIFLLSFQPHKEWRFIVYSLPPIIMTGSVGAAYLWENIKVENAKNFIFLSLIPVSAAISFIFSIIFLNVSSNNYPGGEALTKFNDYIINNNITNSTVHISVPACMTGVTLFGELDAKQYNITYDKTENVTLLEKEWPKFDYLITHEPTVEQFNINPDNSNWEIVQTTKMFTGIDFAYVSKLITSYTDQNSGKQLGKILLENFKDFPKFVTELIEGGESADLVKEIYYKTFARADVFYTYKRIKN